MSDSERGVATSVIGQSKRRSLLVDLALRLVKEKPLGTIGGVIALVFLFAGVFANLLAPYGITEFDLLARLSPPSAEHLLGTDNLGRDMFSRLLYGARISMIVALCVPAISVVVSLLIGGTSGYLGGKYDITIQRLVDAWMCFPPLILYLSVMAAIGGGLLQVILVLGVSGGIGGSRTMRGAVIGIKENMYVNAALAIGCPTWSILVRHVLPNIMAVVIIIFSTRTAGAILSEATLSFLGFGVPPPQPSWGGMLSGAGRNYMLQAPWMALWPGVALSVAVYGISMLGDAVRDVLDPRLRGGVGSYSVAKKRKGSGRARLRLRVP